MADNDDKKDEARFDPKPVQVGGDSIVDRLLPHKKKIIIFIVSGFVIWGAIALVLYIRDKKHEKATDKLAAVLEVADYKVRPAGQPADPAAKEPSYGDAKERANAIVAEIAKQGTDAAGPVYRAAQLMTAGKLDEAITEYRKAQTASGLDGVLAREGLGLAQEAKAMDDKDATAQHKGFEDALATFKTMQPDDKGPAAARAHYHQGRMLVLLNKLDEAKAEFQKAKDLGKDKDPDLVELVDERLAMLGA